MQKFTFDGINKLFIAKSGITEVDVQIDLYSDWKEELLLSDNMKYEQALRTVGGDTISATRNLGDTYFLINDWKIRPYEGDHRLQIEGNLFTDDGTSVMVPTTGSYNVLAEMFVSNIIDSLNITSIASGVVEELKSSLWQHSTQSAGSVIFEDLMTELHAMSVGKIVESSSGVFDFYGSDGTTVLYTLTRTGNQRVPS